ncbi:MAG: hypothetical protein HYR97_06810 [Candidatus Melainabacteria bacterium]|nr:hypothetical protein [Candidatus Melainabacteria bacterium]MBI3309548.1 hypothetical protein [Candidatus Melainabacteria bacterium]
MKVDRRSFLTTASLFTAYHLVRANVPVLESTSYAEETATEPKKYKITGTITSSERIDTDKYAAYYYVNTENRGWFYIVQNKNARTDNVFLAAYDDEQRQNGLVFPQPDDFSKPVAIVDASGAGLKGDFEIYDTGSGYKVKYNIHPLIVVQNHTSVSSKYLMEADQFIKEMPSPITDALNARGFNYMMAKNVEDLYYHLYPYTKNHDKNNPNDPDKPWLEVKEDGTCVDHRNYSNYPAYYYQKRVLAPQTSYKYGSKQLVDKMDYPVWRKHLVFHETGHAVDYINGDDYSSGVNSSKYASKKLRKIFRYSDSDEFQAAFNIDRERMDPKVKDALAYSVCKSEGRHRECFANLYSALVGGETKESAALLLKTFPNATEYVRKKVFSDFKVKMSVEDIRKKIYSDYLKDVEPLADTELKEAAVLFARMFYESDPTGDKDIKDWVVAGPACCGR